MRAGKNTGDPTITGGTFLNGNSEKSDVSMYLAANRGQNSDGSVGELSPENAEAMVGTDYYATLIGALNAAENGQTVALVQDELTITDQITIGDGKNITFDLAGKVLNIIQPILVEGSLTLEDSTATTPPVVSEDYETVTYVSGKIYNTLDSRTPDAVVIEVRNGGAFTLNSGTLDSLKNYTVAVYGQTDATDWETPINSVATINGGYQIGQEGGPATFGNGAVLNVSDGVIVGKDNSAIAGNGTKTDTVNTAAPPSTILRWYYHRAYHQLRLHCLRHLPSSRGHSEHD